MIQFYKVGVSVAVYILLSGFSPDFHDKPGAPVSSLPDKVNVEDSLIKLCTITQNVRPKSLHATGFGDILVTNQLQSEVISFYNSRIESFAGIPDSILNLSVLPPSKRYKYTLSRASFSQFGTYLWACVFPEGEPSGSLTTQRTCEANYNSPPGYVLGIDPHSRKVYQVFEVGKYPSNILVTPDNRYLIVANGCSRDIYIFDLKSQLLKKRIVLGRYPLGLAVHEQTATLYVTLTESSQIARVNLNTLSHEIMSLGQRINPMDIEVNPNGKFLYISQAGSGEVGKYEVLQDTLMKWGSIETGRSPRSLEITPDGAFIYVANYLSHSVTKIRTEDLTITDTVHTPLNPVDISFDASSGQLWVASYLKKNLTVFQDKTYSKGDGKSLAHPFDSFVYSLRSEEANGEPPLSPRPKGIDPSGNLPRFASPQYLLVLGSFSNKVNALEFQKELAQKGLDTYLLPNDGNKFRIGWGRFVSKESAIQAAQKLKAEKGLSAWVKLQE